MENPGEYLKREREHREVPLSKIAESTRVPIKFLEALEADDYDALPHPTFVKGYIKSYCKVLGLDETDAVLRYELYLRERPGRTADEEAAGEAGKKPLHRLAQSRMSEGVPSSGSGPFSVRYIVTAAVVLVAVAIVYYYTASSERTAVPTEQAQAVSTEASADNGPAPPALPALPANGEAAPKPSDGARPAEEAASARAAAPGEKHTLTASAAEISWIKVVIDDEDPFDVVLRAGEKVSWKAGRAFQLVVGNAGGVTIDFDGERLSGLGSSGEVVKLTLPKDAAAPKVKKPVSPMPKTPPATIAPGADISPSTDASLTAPSPRPAVKKTTQASSTSTATGAVGSGAAGTEPKDAGAATAPRWDSKSQEKFDVRPADATAE